MDIPISRPTFKITCKGRPNFSITARDGKVALAPANPVDKYQHWYRYDNPNMKDSTGLPSFVLINKETNLAIEHGAGSGKPVELITFDLFNYDESVFWTQGQDLGSGFGAIRLQRNIGLNMEASGGGEAIIVNSWTNADNQQWKIEAYVTVRLFCKAAPDYSAALSLSNGGLIMKKYDPYDECQHWFKDERYNDQKDSEGFSGFVMINKLTGRVLRKPGIIDGNVAIFDPTVPVDRATLYAEVQTMADGYKRIRNFADESNGVVKISVDSVVHGVIFIHTSTWNGGKDSEIWKIESFNHDIRMSSSSGFYGGSSGSAIASGLQVEERVLGRAPECDCGGGVRAVLRVSETLKNPGILFYGCGRWTPKGKAKCQFFQWVDLDLLTLQSSIRRVEEKIDGITARQWWEKMMFFVVVFAVVAWAIANSKGVEKMMFFVVVFAVVAWAIANSKGVGVLQLK